MVADEALLQGVERRRADIPEHHAQRPQCQERQLLLRMAVAHPLTRSIRHPHRTRCCRGGYRTKLHYISSGTLRDRHGIRTGMRNWASSRKEDAKNERLARSEENTSELQSLM